jgi:cation:H+ antiporter
MSPILALQMPEDPQNLALPLVIPLLIAGAGAMIFGAHLLVISSVRIARRVGLSPFFIGVTVVAFGTSVPELAASLYAQFNDKEALALGNVIGSNIANLALVLGVVALFKPIPVKAPTLRRDLALVCLVGLVPLLALPFGDTLGIWHGIGLLALLGGFLWMAKKHNRTDDYETLEIDGQWPIWLITLALISGPCLLWAGSTLFVESAASMGRSAGISEAVVGLTIVAFTTSLPELVTSIYAAIRGYQEVGIGNILGSCIMNVLAVLGLVLVFGDIPVEPQIYRLDVPALLLVSLVCVPILLSGRRVTRPEGGLLVALYVIYVGVLFTLAPGWFPAATSGG